MGADLWFCRMPSDFNAEIMHDPEFDFEEHGKEIGYFRNYGPLNVAVGVMRDLRYPEGHPAREDPWNVREEIFPEDLEKLRNIAEIIGRSAKKIGYSEFLGHDKSQDQEVARLVEEMEKAFACGDRIIVIYSA